MCDLPLTHLVRVVRGLVIVVCFSAALVQAQGEGFAPRTEYRYAGEATLTVHHLDDVRQLEETKTYAYELVVLIGPPLRFGREVEDNPVHLEIVARSSAARQEEGQVGLSSASTMDGLKQHWTLHLEGDRLEGALTGVEEGTLGLILDEVNHLNSRRRTGYTGFATDATSYDTLAYGSSLSGTVSDERVQLRVEGNVVAGDRPFALAVSASRVDMLGQPALPRDVESAPEPEPVGAAAPAEDAPVTVTQPPVVADAVAPPTAEEYLGRFEDAELVLTLERGGDGFVGVLVFRGETYPVTARLSDGLLHGSFLSDGHAFPFDASVTAHVLTLNTAGTQYTLERAVEGPRNPLGR